MASRRQDATVDAGMVFIDAEADRSIIRVLYRTNSPA
jgi:hypothetical protein